MKYVWRYCLVLACLMAGYVLFGVVSQLLPNKPIERHVQRTVDNDDLAADFGFAVVCRPELYMDNFTDALIVNQAICGGRDHLWKNVMLVPRQTDWQSECGSLRHVVARDTVLPEKHYGRYWHGSTFAMRWLLQVEDYTMLRLLMYVVSSLLLLWVCVALWRRLGAVVAGLYLLSLVMVNVFVMQLSIQFLPVLVLALGATLWVLYRVKRPGQICMTLFVTGSLTAYFDLLTCPALTWGMPLCVYVLMSERETLSRRLVVAGGASVLWAVGYGVSWVMKWVLATLTTSENVLRDGFREFTVRSGATQDFTRWDAMLRNANMLSWTWVCAVLVVLVVLAVLRFRREGWSTAVLCLLVALPPLLWYVVAAEHSYLHFWFTYRSMAVVLFALFSAVGSLVEVRIKK
jgi:hypothetical protein